MYNEWSVEMCIYSFMKDRGNYITAIRSYRPESEERRKTG
jgi:hypothetical protein